MSGSSRPSRPSDASSSSSRPRSAAEVVDRRRRLRRLDVLAQDDAVAEATGRLVRPPRPRAPRSAPASSSVAVVMSATNETGSPARNFSRTLVRNSSRASSPCSDPRISTAERPGAEVLLQVAEQARHGEPREPAPLAALDPLDARDLPPIDDRADDHVLSVLPRQHSFSPNRDCRRNRCDLITVGSRLSSGCNFVRRSLKVVARQDTKCVPHRHDDAS